MRKPFALYFNETGVIGLDPPHSTEAVDLAEQFAALRRWSVAIQDFSERIQAIEEAYQEVFAQ